MVILHIIIGLADGGAESVLYRICQSDRANRHVIIAMMGKGKYGSLLEEMGIEVHYLGMKRERFDLLKMVKLWRIIKHVNVDVVQTWMYHADLVGGIMSRISGKRKIFWGIRHSDLEAGASSRSTIVISRVCAMLSGWLPYGIICCAERAAQVHVKRGYNKTKLRVVHNGYDVDRFRPDLQARDRVRRALGLDDQARVIGMVARFDPQKDHWNLLSAVSESGLVTKGTKLLLVGSGIDHGNHALTNYLEEHGLLDDVYLLGARNDIVDVMNAMDILVLSSRFGEGFPNVVAEAMACGVPCVVTDVGDASFIVEDTGWVVPPRNRNALAMAVKEALEEFVHSPHRWACRQAACRRRIAEHFSLERMITEFNKAWEE